ncbi:MAG: phosphate-starvation-inducible PsiE family protein [Burkholderiales bacterium]|nr:phosphate-starvation-inducible PsiE family protein [Burkholderiales bacterium]
MKNPIQNFNQWLLALVEHIGLLVIAIATVIAMSSEVLQMWQVQRVTLADLLLLFIYLEVLTMVGLYYGTGKLPVRFPLYIGMVALARYLILDMKEMDGLRILAVTGAVLMLAIAVLAIRYGHIRYPYAGNGEDEESTRDAKDK